MTMRYAAHWAQSPPLSCPPWPHGIIDRHVALLRLLQWTKHDRNWATNA
jgi:hypothetical protein